MNIKIDVREKELITHIKYFIDTLPNYKDIHPVIETLPLGDVILENKGVEKLIIERKSIRDLGASIKDGRYEEQSYRLNGYDIPNHNIIYLIEGDVNKINKFKDKTDRITIFSAMFSLNYTKGFSVIRTMNIEETALFICNCANKLRNLLPFPPLGKGEPNLLPLRKVEPNPTPNLEPLVNTPLEQTDFLKAEKVDNYVSVIKKVKKENITSQNIDEIMLCQIPGISSITASAIIKEYKSIYDLTKQIKENGTECLKNITYVTGKNQTRKINKTIVENIAKFLLK
jgi:ERCC4-type nuclease